nr:hypothetical protein Iba_chr08bCG14020 [Ipomoea batatas]
MAEPPPAPPSKRGPASKTLEKSMAPGSILRSRDGKATHDRDLEKSKKKVNRKLAMDSEIDQKKVIGSSENVDEQNPIPEKLIEDQPKDCQVNSELGQDTMAQQDPQMKTVEHLEVNQGVNPIENQSSEAESNEEARAKAEVEEELELVDLKPALEMIAELSGLRTKLTSDEYAMMSEEILKFAKMIANEQSGDQETLRSGIRAIADRFEKETKLNQGKENRESDQPSLEENGESGSSSWQEEFSTDLLEEMKGLCEVYALANGGFNSKEETDEVMLRVIRELRSNSLRELKGKMKQHGQEEQAKGVTFAPSMENQLDNAGTNLEALNSKKDIAADRGTSHVCENAPKSRNAHMNKQMEEMTSKNNGVDPGINRVPTGASPGNQKLGKQPGDSVAAPGWGKNVNMNAGNNGGNASQGWGNRQGFAGNQRTNGPGPTMDRGRNQNKDNKEGKQSRNPSKNRNGGQSPQKDQAPNRGPAGGLNARNGKQNNAPQRREAGKSFGSGTPGKQTGGSGYAGTSVRGEGSFRYQNYERGGGNSRGGGRGYQGRGGWGGSSGVTHDAVKDYEREGAELCRSLQVVIGAGAGEHQQGRDEESLTVASNCSGRAVRCLKRLGAAPECMRYEGVALILQAGGLRIVHQNGHEADIERAKRSC